MKSTPDFIDCDVASEFKAHPSTVDLSVATSISIHAAKVLARCFSYPLPLNGLTTLSAEVAYILAQHDHLSLNGLTEMSEDTASALAWQGGHLFLDGLNELSEDAAYALSKHHGEIFLRGLKTLAPVAAFALRKHKHITTNLDLKAISLGLHQLSEEGARMMVLIKRKLRLDGLTELSAATAAILAKHQGKYLSLNGLSELSDAAAFALASYKNEIFLEGLNKISPLGAYALQRQGNVIARLNLKEISESLSELSEEGARTFSAKKDDIVLDGVRELSPAPAAAFAEHEGLLSLSGLTSLSDAVATALAEHTGPLHLNGLAHLSTASAAALAEHKDLLSLNGLTVLLDAVATALAKHTGPLHLNGLAHLSTAAAAALAEYGGSHLSLNGITYISSGAANDLAKSQALLITLDGLTGLADDAAYALGLHKSCRLSLRGLCTLSPMAARSLFAKNITTSLDLWKVYMSLTELTEREAEMIISDIQKYRDNKCPLSLDCVTALSDATALVLVRHKGQITLPALKKLSPFGAHALLSQMKVCTNLNLNEISRSLTELSEEDAKMIALIEGHVCLDALKDLSYAAAAALAEHKGPCLSLNGLTELSDPCALVMTQLKTPIYLKNLRQISPLGAIALTCCQKVHLGHVDIENISSCLTNLTDLTEVGARIIALSTRDHSLDGLTELSDSAAFALARHRGNLALPRLHKISPFGAHALLAHGKVETSIDLKKIAGNLRELSLELAQVIASSTIGHSLDELTELSEDVAMALSGHKGEYVSLAGLTALPDTVAVALGKHKGKSMILDGVIRLSVTAALGLAEHNGRLSLCGLTEISEPIALALAKHNRGDLHLDGLTVMSDSAVAALAAHKGMLSVGKLTGLSPFGAIALLANGHCDDGHCGNLDLHEILAHQTELSEEMARIAAQGKASSLELKSVTHVSVVVATQLAKYQGDLWLDAVTELSDAAAGALGEYKGGSLSLDGLTTLSDGAAHALAEYSGLCRHDDGPGYLSLNGLKKLSNAAALALSKNQIYLSIQGLTDLSDSIELALEGFTARPYSRAFKARSYMLADNCMRLTEWARESLEIYKREACLSILPMLSVTAASALERSEHNVDYIVCNDLTQLSQATARLLVVYAKGLVSHSLGELEDAVFLALSGTTCHSLLDSLKMLPERSIRALEAHKEDSRRRFHLKEWSDAAVWALAAQKLKCDQRQSTICSEQSYDDYEGNYGYGGSDDDGDDGDDGYDDCDDGGCDDGEDW